MTIYLAQKIHNILLNVEKILENILAKYLNFAKIFFKKLAIEMLLYSYINEYTINLKIDKQLLY